MLSHIRKYCNLEKFLETGDLPKKIPFIEDLNDGSGSETKTNQA